MREKNKIKIVLSLLIALAFVLPTASVMGVGNSSTELEKASTPTKNVINVGTAESAQIQVLLPQNEMTPMDDDGCFPVDVTELSVDGVPIEDGDIIPTGTYPIDMTVCKTEWDPCMGIWSDITIDVNQEGWGHNAMPPTTDRPLFPLVVRAMCDEDYIHFNFTVIGTNGGGDYEPVDVLQIYVRGDGLGPMRVYQTTLSDPDTTKIYYNGLPIPGSNVVRMGGWPIGEPEGIPATVNVTIPRDGYWSICCGQVEWWWTLASSLTPENYQWGDGNLGDGGWLPDICTGDYYPATVKKFVEIYQKVIIPENATENKTVQIYCEDFEDPCEIMLNWSTIDMPVWGANGALDTWTWSDKRYCSAGHSMHSTSFDVYMPDQYDILRLNFGGDTIATGGLDVSDYCQICVSWCQWIQGDAFNIGNETVPVMVIQDYGYFQYSFDGINYIPVTATKYYNSDGVTETIEVCIDTVQHDELFFQWVWKSDPKFCYEGWYIDDVCIEGTICGEIITDERTTWKFVYDSHSWPQTFEDECETYIFNETWIAKEGEYRICGWLEALDDCHTSSTPYDDMFCVYIKVGDILDLEVDCNNVVITPEPPVNAGTDVTISAEICNVGTLDATNVQVNAKIGRGFYFGGLEESFETQSNEANGIMKRWDNPVGEEYMTEWVTNWNAMPRSYAHYTTYDHSDGSQAVANWYYDETTAQPWLHSTTGANDYLRGPDQFVLGHMGANLVVTYDAKMNYGVGEELRPGLWDWDLGSGFFYYGETGPYYADWATYSYELTPLFESLVSGGAAPTDAFCLGFIFLKNAVADGDPTCPWQAKWRGYVLDNIIIPPAIPTGEVVLDETQIIPHLNASSPCVDLHWHWNDTLVGDYYFCVEILNPDSNLENNKCCDQYQIYNYVECPDFYCVDYTGQGPGHWLSDGCCGGVLWAGTQSTTTYGNDWDDSLFLKNKTGGINFNVPGVPICVTYDTWFQLANNDYGIFEYSLDGGMHWIQTKYYGNSSTWVGADSFGWLLDKSVCFTGTAKTQMRFRFTSNLTGIQRGILIDNIEVRNDTTDFVMFASDGTDMSKFYAHETQTGCWFFQPNIWQHFVWDDGYWSYWQDDEFQGEPGNESHLDEWWYATPDGGWEISGGVYDPAWQSLVGTPGYGKAYVNNLDCALVWDINSTGLWKAWFTAYMYYDTETSTAQAYWNTSSPYYSPNLFNDTGFIEAKSDTETEWTTLYETSGSYLKGNYPLWVQAYYDWYTYTEGVYIALDGFMEDTEKASVQFRFISDEVNNKPYLGYGFSDMSCLYGMRDLNPPVSQASMTGTFDEECHWYTSPVTITVTATDDLTGVCTIYYELDGVVHEYIMPVVVNTDGTHTFCYWAVDCEGNVEAKKCLPEFRIDLTGPSVSITGPATGYLYLFGNQLFALKSGKTIFLFNGIPVTATATAQDASIATVQFFLDDVLMTEDTTAPYSARLSTKHSGPATIKVTAIDVLGHSASDTLNIDNYLKLF